MNNETSYTDMQLFTKTDGITQIPIVVDEYGKGWVSCKSQAELFGKGISTIDEHLANILETGELKEDSVFRDFRITASDGKKYNVTHYCIEVVVLVGFKVNSQQAIEFRKWANSHLKSVMMHGYSLDKPELLDDREKLKMLVDDTRKLRQSEFSLYKELKNSLAKSTDYVQDTPESKLFFSTLQNKLHYAVHGHTAAELIVNRVNHMLPVLGLQSFTGRIPKKQDTLVAKNYMTSLELLDLERLVNLILDFALLSNKEHTMHEWLVKINGILDLTDRQVLSTFSKISYIEAINTASSEFHLYQQKMQDDPTFPRLNKTKYILGLEEIADIVKSSIIPLFITDADLSHRNELVIEFLTLILDSFHNCLFLFEEAVYDSVKNFTPFLRHWSFSYLSQSDRLRLSAQIVAIHKLILAALPPDVKHPFTLASINIQLDRAVVFTN